MGWGDNMYTDCRINEELVAARGLLEGSLRCADRRSRESDRYCSVREARAAMRERDEQPMIVSDQATRVWERGRSTPPL